MPQKQGSSPKLKNANGTRKATVAKAGRRAAPGKGRSNGASKYGLKSNDKPLFEAIAEDRRQQPNRRHSTTNPNRFAAKLGHHVAISADKANWSPGVRQLVCDYVKSLVNGGGNVPDGLRGKPLQDVQFKFAMCCFKMNVPEGTFPGQSQDWFDEATAKVHHFWRNRRSAA